MDMKKTHFLKIKTKKHMFLFKKKTKKINQQRPKQVTKLKILGAAMPHLQWKAVKIAFGIHRASFGGEKIWTFWSVYHGLGFFWGGYLDVLAWLKVFFGGFTVVVLAWF